MGSWNPTHLYGDFDNKPNPQGTPGFIYHPFRGDPKVGSIWICTWSTGPSLNPEPKPQKSIRFGIVRKGRLCSSGTYYVYIYKYNIHIYIYFFFGGGGRINGVQHNHLVACFFLLRIRSKSRAGAEPLAGSLTSIWSLNHRKLDEKIGAPKNWQVASPFFDAGLLPFFFVRVVSSWCLAKITHIKDWKFQGSMGTHNLHFLGL